MIERKRDVVLTMKEVEILAKYLTLNSAMTDAEWSTVSCLKDIARRHRETVQTKWLYKGEPPK